MSYVLPPRGGTITVDRPTKESETKRPLWYTGQLLLIRLTAALLLFFEIALVGVWAGPLLVLGSLWYGAQSAGIWLRSNGLPRIEYKLKPGMGRNPTWLLGSLLGYVLTVAAVSGYWLPVAWTVHDKLLWLVTPWGAEAIFPKLYTTAIWVRWALILGMPWITWRPFSLLHWVFEVENTFKNLREVSFWPADPGTIPTPMGTLSAHRAVRPVGQPVPASSAPLHASPTGQVAVVGTPAAQHAPPIDLS